MSPVGGIWMSCCITVGPGVFKSLVSVCCAAVSPVANDRSSHVELSTLILPVQICSASPSLAFCHHHQRRMYYRRKSMSPACIMHRYVGCSNACETGESADHGFIEFALSCPPWRRSSMRYIWLYLYRISLLRPRKPPFIHCILVPLPAFYLFRGSSKLQIHAVAILRFVMQIPYQVQCVTA